MTNQAINKLRQEIEENRDNLYINYVGNYLVDYITRNNQYSEKFMNEEKTIKGSLEYMKTKAKAQAKNGMAMLTPEEGFEVILDYYEIKPATKLKVVGTQKKVDISLDELL